MTPPFERFTAELPFLLSAYQEEALLALATPGFSVIVIAPTGSGKSVVADAAIWQALEPVLGAAGRGARAAYTSPLRALANQRFAQLTARWGNRVGLTTGDQTIRPHAAVQVMTTEVYRTLALLPKEADHGNAFTQRLEWAIFDEAHYLSDPERGTVWEESILATPPQTRILCLSATIGSPERLAGWLRWLGREVALVEASERPVPLRHMLALRGDLHLVLDEHGQRQGSFPFAGGWALAQRRPAHTRGGPYAKRARMAPLPNLPVVAPQEWIRQEALAALRLLRQRELIPVIAFVSGRREAELLAAAAQVAFPDQAEGVAFHHAGVLPEARWRVEHALARGDLWLVCGTTTLAAGLDVPARSVLVTSFGRYDGKAFRLFSPAEYRQLTGRAGRLGKDESGTVVLLASPWHSFEEAFRTLTGPVPPLASVFRPTYPTALAWWAAGGEAGLARALATTFAAYLRRLGTRKVIQPEPVQEVDGPSVLQARAIGRLLALDGLVDDARSLTARGRFVLRTAGGSEGRLLLRLVEAGGLAQLPEAWRMGLLGMLAEGPAPGDAPEMLDALRAAYGAQIHLEREAGALLTPPLVEPEPRAPIPDAWRRQQQATDLLERAQRAARRTGVAAELLESGPLPETDRRQEGEIA